MVKVTIEINGEIQNGIFQSVMLIGNLDNGTLTAGLFGGGKVGEVREDLAIGTATVIRDMYSAFTNDESVISKAGRNFVTDFNDALSVALEELE